MKESDFEKWYATHADDCQVNYQESSDLMETVGAKEIFLRSIKKHNLKYTVFVGDGDSSCFGVVREACWDEYGVFYIVTKEECVGHVQMGTRLRTYKKKNARSKAIGWKNCWWWWSAYRQAY